MILKIRQKKNFFRFSARVLKSTELKSFKKAYHVWEEGKNIENFSLEVNLDNNSGWVIKSFC